MSLKPIIRLNNIYSTVENLSTTVLAIEKGRQKRLIDYLYDEISYAHPNAVFVQMSKPGWDGRFHLFKKGTKSLSSGSFLTGLFSTVAKLIFEYSGLVPEVIDERIKPERNLDLKWNEEKYKLRDYQIAVIEECLKKGRGIINISTGAGKTLIAANLIFRLGISPFIFYVLTKDLLYQAKDRIEEAMTGLSVGVIGDGFCEIKDINVMTIQTATRAYGEDFKKEIKKSEEWDEDEIELLETEDLSHIEKKKEEIRNLIENCVGLYFDELHHSASRTCKETITKSEKAYYIFGGSATPTRSDNANLLIEGLFGRERGKITASMLIKDGFLMKPIINFIKIKKKKERVQAYEDDYKTHIMLCDERNDKIITIAKKMMSENIPTLVLIQRIEHGKYLQSKLEESEFVHGGTNSKKRKQALADIQNGKLKLLIATVLADEGLDLPVLGAVVIGGGGKSGNRMKQRVGRVIRKAPDKKYAYVFDFMDVGKWTAKHSKARYEILKEEPEFDLNIIEEFDFSKIKQKKIC